MSNVWHVCHVVMEPRVWTYIVMKKRQGKHLAQRGRGCIYIVREKDVINWATFNIHTIKT